jgi:hypothetical protein
MPVLGPGTLTIGETGTEIDISCLVNGARITADKSEGEETVKMCGTRVPGSVTYSPTLTGNLDVDSEDDAGLFALSWAEPGTQLPFTFTPSTATETTPTGGTAAAGTLQVDPLDFGADAFGDPLTSDFTFTIVGDVTFTYPTGVTRTLRTGVPIRRPRIPFAPAEPPAAKAGKGTAKAASSATAAA